MSFFVKVIILVRVWPFQDKYNHYSQIKISSVHMKQEKSRSLDRISRQQDEIRQKVDHFLKETQKAKIVYPRKKKQSEEPFEIIRQSRQIEEQEKQTPKLMSKFTSKKDAIPNKKSLSLSNYEKDESKSRKSVLSKYQQPKITESFAILTQQKQNPEKYQRSDQLSRVSNRSHIKSEKHIFQKSDYRIQEDPNFNRSSSARQNQRNLTQVVNKVGIKNNQEQNDFNQYTDLKGIHQFIRKKKNSGTSSILGKAYTEPPEKLETIQEAGRSSSFRFNNPEKKRNVVRSESRSKQLDLFIPYEHGGSYLPEIEKSRSVSKLLNKKMRTEASTPNQIKEDFRKELKNKIDKKIGKPKSPLSKQPSAKRLLQDYKYVLEKDDSQRIRQRSKPLLNEEKKKLKFLKIKEEMLGKIVLQRVQKHLFQEKKQKPNYITKVKSEKSIDEALVQFLKMKVKRADKALNQ